jgi:hypothetical protein
MCRKLTGLLILCLLFAPILAVGAVSVGQTAPDFTVQALGDDGQAGDMVSLSDYAGKIVVLDLFATW